MQRILGWIAAVLTGVALGAASAWAALAFGHAGFVEQYGAWSYSRAAGATSADHYTRAIVAREGLLALRAEDALYFTLSKDENGRPLDESCVYELRGRALAARWWSITLYAGDNFLARNTDNAHAIDASRLGETGAWRARIAPVRGEAIHWLSSREARRGFIIMLRVYNPQRAFRPSEAALPELTTLSCADTAT